MDAKERIGVVPEASLYHDKDTIRSKWSCPAYIKRT